MNSQFFKSRFENLLWGLREDLIKINASWNYDHRIHIGSIAVGNSIKRIYYVDGQLKMGIYTFSSTEELVAYVERLQQDFNKNIFTKSDFEKEEAAFAKLKELFAFMSVDYGAFVVSDNIQLHLRRPDPMEELAKHIDQPARSIQHLLRCLKIHRKSGNIFWGYGGWFTASGAPKRIEAYLKGDNNG